jgi:hypothetical protein
MKHATHMESPVGRLPIREGIAKRLHGMTDKEVADETFKSSQFINPEAFAELTARGLCYRGDMESDVYARIAKRDTGQ